MISKTSSNDVLSKKLNELHTKNPSLFNYIEVVLAAIFATFIIAQMLEVSGANFVLSIGGGVLSIFYFLKSQLTYEIIHIEDDEERKSLLEAFSFKVFINRLNYYSLSLLILGVMFSALHFPGADTMLLVGGFTQVLCFIFIVLSLLKSKGFTQLYWLRTVVAIVLFLAFQDIFIL